MSHRKEVLEKEELLELFEPKHHSKSFYIQMTQSSQIKYLSIFHNSLFVFSKAFIRKKVKIKKKHTELREPYTVFLDAIIRILFTAMLGMYLFSSFFLCCALSGFCFVFNSKLNCNIGILHLTYNNIH